jgi:hypothetical protein
MCVMGRPGCRQCCDDESVETCAVSDSDITVVYRDSNNKKINVDLLDIRDIIRTSEDQKPENAPEDYDDFIINESILRVIEDGDYTIVEEGQFPQVIKSTFYNDGKYSFEADFYSPFSVPYMQRMEVKTKNREFFYRWRMLNSEEGDTAYSDVQIKELDISVPAYGGTGFKTDPDFTLRFSPDIIDIDYQTSGFGSPQVGGFCFNMKEELGSYLNEDDLEVVDFTIFLDPEKMTELTDAVPVVNASDVKLTNDNGSESFDHFSKFSVYTKDLKSKKTYMIIKTPSPVSIGYRDHRVVGGHLFFSSIDKEFIDNVNTINEQTKVRESLFSLFLAFLQERGDWTIVDSGSADAATKTQFQDTFLSDAKEYIEERYKTLSYTKVAYIGDVDQDRDRNGFRVRTSIEEADYTVAELVLDNIFEDESFLAIVIGLVELISIGDLEGGFLVDFTYEISRGFLSFLSDEVTADVTLKDDLLSSTSLPKAEKYTHKNIFISVKDLNTDIDYSYIPPIIGESKSATGLWEKLSGFNGYREKYYISIEYTNPTGAFLNGLDATFLIIENNLFGGGIIENTRTGIGTQLFVEPRCGYIQSRENVLLPLSYDSSLIEDLQRYGSTMRDYTKVHDKYTADYAVGTFDTQVSNSSANRSCLSSGQYDYSQIINKAIEIKTGPSVASTYSVNSFARPINFRVAYANYDEFVELITTLHTVEPVPTSYDDPDYGRIENYADKTSVEIVDDHISIDAVKSFCRDMITLRRQRDFSSGLATFFRRTIRGNSYFIVPGFHGVTTNYNRFEDESIKTNTFISQWPSEVYYTIDMKPNNGNMTLINKPVQEFNEDEDGDKIVNRFVVNRVSSFGKNVSWGQGSNLVFNLQNVLYNNEDLYSNISVDSTVFMGDDLHSLRFDHSHSEGSPNTLILESLDLYDGVFVDEYSDGLNFLDVVLMVLEYEKNVSKIEIRNNQKQIYLGSGGIVHSEFFDYASLLEADQEEYDFSFSTYNGTGKYNRDYKELYPKPNHGEGTTSSSATDNARKFFNQNVYIFQGPLVSQGMRLIFDKDGYFLDADMSLGFAVREKYISQTEPLDHVKNICLSTQSRCGCTSYSCENCMAEDGIYYNLNTYKNSRDVNNLNNFGEPVLNRSYISGDQQEIIIEQNTSTQSYPQDPCPAYILSSNLRVVAPGNGHRIKKSSGLPFGGSLWNIGNLYDGFLSVKPASYSGSLSTTLEWSSCRFPVRRYRWGELHGGGPMFAPNGEVGGSIMSSSPGYHIYRGVEDLGDYYYYNYKLRVASSVSLRSYAKYSNVTAGPSEFSHTTTNNTYIIQPDFSLNLFLDVESKEQYGEWVREGCLNSLRVACEEAWDNVNIPDFEFPVGIVTSQSVDSYNFAPARDTWFFVEDQSYTDVDIRSFPQNIVEVRNDPYGVSRNERLGYNGETKEYFIEDLKLIEVVVNWGG